MTAIVPLAAIGGLLAAGLLEGLAWRRRVQLQTRPDGRRIPSARRPRRRSPRRCGAGSGR